jgi:hypothetical protein
MKKILTILLFSAATLACMPEEQVNPTNPTINNPLEINAPSGFTWSTTTTLNVRLNKLFIPVSIVRAVEIVDEAGTVYFKGSHDLSTDFSLNVTIPTHIEGLSMQIGEITMHATKTGNQLTFTFPIIEPTTAD